MTLSAIVDKFDASSETCWRLDSGFASPPGGEFWLVVTPQGSQIVIAEYENQARTFSAPRALFTYAEATSKKWKRVP